MKHFFLFNALLLFFTVSAQNFKQGYFIDKSGNKTECLITTDIINESPDGNLTYRLQDKGTINTIDCYGLSEIAITNVIVYKKYNVKVETSSKRQSELTAYKNLDLVNKDVFLEVMEKGKLTLLGLVDNNNLQFYYLKEGMETPELLDYKEYMGGESKSYILKNEFYKQELLNIMVDAGFSDQDVFKVAYTKNEMVDLFKKYNLVFGGRVEMNTTERKSTSPIKFFIKPRIGFSMISASSLYSDKSAVQNPYSKSEFSSKFVPEIGFEAELKVKNALSFFLVTSYHSVKMNSDQIIYGNFSPIQTIETELKCSSVRFILGIRKYFEIHKNYNIYVNGLGVFEMVSKDSYSKTMPSKFNLNNEIGLGLGLGLQFFKRTFVEVNYEFKRNLTSDYQFLNTPFSTLSLSFMYSLNK
ncbi:hypothetical protein [Flavobacterium sp. N1719]|uniref:hypothetical protein n=1 Tax=Flavobacterium sp. N1719 TaxID=2885633 RepID=UPI00222285A5|nr:hypothetical protein [Flavobacterium sp. N1719]